MLVASQGGGQTVLLGASALRTQPPLTVLQQGGQQILLPPGFHASALNIKGLQGLKVIPITPSPAAKGKWHFVRNKLSFYKFKNYGISVFVLPQLLSL